MSTIPDLTGHGPGADTVVTLPDFAGYGFTPRGKHQFTIQIGPRVAVGHDHTHEITPRWRVSSEGADSLLFARWDVHRFGGCGIFQVVIGGDLQDAEDAADEEWEIEIWVKLEGEAALSLWYRGYVTTFWRSKVKDRWTTTLQGLGYSGQLRRLAIDVDYTSQLSDVIVKDLMDTYACQAADPSTDVYYDDADIAAGVTVADFKYTGSLVRALRALAIVQGDVEWGVSESRKLFWFARDTTTIRHHLVERRNLIDIVQAGAQQKRSTSVTIEGRTTHKTVSATRANAPAASDLKKERIVQATSLSEAADLDAYAAGLLLEYDTTQEWLALKISEIQEAYHRATIAAPRPLGMYRVHFTDGTTKDYQFGRVTYRIGGDPNTPEGKRTASALISAELWLGGFSKSLHEEVEELDAEVEQLRMKLRQLAAAPQGAEYVTTAAHADLTAEVVFGTSLCMRGALSLRPATAKTGALYWASDTRQLFRYSGSVTTGWEELFVDGRYEASATTTDATKTTVLSYAMPDETVAYFEMRGLGLVSGGNAGVYHKALGFKRVGGGGVAAIGSGGYMVIDEDDSGWGTVAAEASGNSVIITVTGKAATTIKWKVRVNVTTHTP